MKKFFFKSLAIGLLALIPAFSWAASTLTVNDGPTTTNNAYIPVYGNYCDALQQSQFIIPASSLTAIPTGNVITSLKFYCGNSKPAEAWTSTWNVRLKEVTSTTQSSFDAMANSTQVLTAKTFNASTGELYIAFDEAYTYNGGNLLVDIKNNAAGNYKNSNFVGISATFGSSIYKYSTYSPSQQSFLPKVTITYDNPPSCVKTASISVTNITDSAATISWAAVSNAQDYEVTVGNDVYNVSGTTSKTVTGLTPNKKYNVSVVTDCGGGDKSEARTTSFSTALKITKAVPFTEGFDNWDNYGFDETWNRVTYTYSSNDYPCASSSSALVGTKSLAFYGGKSDAVTYAVLPLFVNDLGSLVVEFLYKNYSTSSYYAQFALGTMTDPSDPSTFAKIEDLTRKTSSTLYQKNLSGVVSGNKYLAIKYYNATGSSSYYNNYASYIDDFKISLPATCFVPTALTLEQATTTTAMVSWTPAASEENWDVQIKAAADAEWPSAVATTDINTYEFEGLNDATTYNVRVRSNCGSDDVSAWSNPITFTTDCEAVTITTSWSENFDLYSNNTCVPCWDNSASTSTDLASSPYYIWGVYNKAIRMNNYNVHGNTALVNMPTMILPTGKKYSLVFDYCHNASCGAFKVKVSKNNGSSFTTLGTYDKNDNTGSYTNPATWIEGEIDLKDFAGDTIKIQFYSEANYGSGAIFIDNISIEEAATCSKPALSDDIVVTENSATLTWTGETAQCQYVCVLKDSVPNWDNAILVSSKTATIESLSANTEYDFYVRSYCSASDQSKSDKKTFRTACGLATLPFSENFDKWSAIDPCWTKVGTNSPSSSYTAKSGKGIGFTATSALVLPELDANLEDIKLSFWYKKAYSSTTSGYLYVGVTALDPSTLTTSDLSTASKVTQIGSVYCSNYSSFNEYPLDFSTIDASKLTGKKYILIYSKSTNSYFIDDLSIKAVVPKPTNLTADSVSADSVHFTFEQSASKGKWYFQISKSNSWGKSDVVAEDTITTMEFAKGNLKSGKTYYARVKHIDPATKDESNWSTVANATTECGLAAFPFSDDFTGGVSACWIKNGVSAESGGNDLSINNTCAFMPEINMGTQALAGCQLNFSIESFSSNTPAELKVVASASREVTGAELATLPVAATYIIPGGSKYNNNCEVFLDDSTINYTNYPYLGFYVVGNRTVYIDNVVLKVADKRAPTNLETLALSSDSVKIGFEQKGECSLWRYQVSKQENFSDTLVNETTSAKAFVVKNLEAQTTYYARVRQEDDAVNHWSETKTFTTECFRLAYDSIDFEAFTASDNLTYNAKNVPTCWTSKNSDNNTSYMPFITTYNSNYKSATKYMYLSGSSTSNSWMALPQLADGDAVQNVAMKFFASRYYYMYEQSAPTLTVGVMTDPTDVSTFVPVKSFTNISSSYKEVEVDFYTYSGEGMYIAFMLQQQAATFYIDDLSFVYTTCRAPKEAEVTDITTTTATLHSGLTDKAWAYKLGEGAWQSVNAGTESADLSLVAGQEYVVKVKTICGAMEESDEITLNFNSVCEQATALGYAEDFENGISICMKSIGAELNSTEGVDGSKCVTMSLSKEAIILPEFASTDYKTLALTYSAKSNTAASLLYVIAYDENESDLAKQTKLDSIATMTNYESYLLDLSMIEDINTIIGTKRIGFFRKGGSAAFVDNIAIVAAPQFKTPTSVAKVEDTETPEGVTFTFEQLGDTTSGMWVVETATESLFDNIVAQDTVYTQVVTLTGLEMDRPYYVRVKQIYSEGETPSSNTMSFKTTCSETMPLNTVFTFDWYTKDEFPACWSARGLNTTPVIDSKKIKIKGGGTYLNGLVTSPALDDDADRTILAITFDAYMVTTLSTDTAILQIGLANCNAAEATSIEKLTASFKGTSIEINTTATTYNVYLNSIDGLTEAYKYVAFLSTFNTSCDIYIDNVEVRTLPWEMIRSGLSNAQLGTVCQSKNIVAVRGGELFGVEYGNTSEVTFIEKALPIAAGEPMLFKADGTNNGKIEVLFGDEEATVARHDEGKDGVKGLVGLISTSAVNKLDIESGNILVSGGRLRLTGTGCWINPDRAYIKTSEMPATGSSAPGRRIRLTADGMNIVTNMTEVQANAEGVFKFVRDGQMFILREGKLFNAQGQYLR